MKSIKGNLFNKEIQHILFKLVENDVLSSVVIEPKVYIPGYNISSFNPDFLIKVNEGHFIFIDNTTTIRSDRIKQKQWDAHGVKTAYANTSIKIECFVIVKNLTDIGNEKTRQTEIKNVQKEKEKMKNPNYYSALDKILYVDELIDYLNNLSNNLFQRAS